MNNTLRMLVRLAIASLMVSGTMAFAQEKAKDTKAAPPAAPAAAAKKGEPAQEVFLENDHVRVFKVTFKPGDAGASVARPKRVIHVLKGGTLTLIYPDGKKEKLDWKDGETKVRDVSPAYSPKNEGKSDIVLFVVNTKEPKK